MIAEAGFGGDEELDVLVADELGSVVQLDSATLQEPMRHVDVSVCDMVPAILDIVFLALQLAAFVFASRPGFAWSPSANGILYANQPTQCCVRLRSHH